MINVKIRNIIGENAVTMKQGEILYTLLKKNFEENITNKNFKITIDFKDVNVISSPFFNASICFLLKDYDISDCQRIITFENMREDTRGILNIAIKNAIEYYK